MSELFLYDDATARAFEPFALTRPTSELRAGAVLLRERWEYALGLKAAGIVSAPHLEHFEEPWSPSVVRGALPKGSLVANSRFAVALSRIESADVYRAGERVVAVRLDRAVDAKELAGKPLSLEGLAKKGARATEVRGRWIEHVWDFIAHLSPMLNEDLYVLCKGVKEPQRLVFLEQGGTIETQVFFDVSGGPVLVRQGATVQAFTRVVGPCVIGAGSTVGVDRISGSAIGEGCRVHGELSASILLGHTNKSHDGFVGHSYLGRWVNLGAGTTTSNLKNTYGTVQLWTPDGDKDTGQQFLGAFFGDHAKTGIGTQLTTGTVIGAGANIYGSDMPAGVVPPFAWGDGAPYETYRLDKFLEVARRVMERRNVTLSDRQVRQLTAARKKRWSVKRAKGKKR